MGEYDEMLQSMESFIREPGPVVQFLAVPPLADCHK